MSQQVSVDRELQNWEQRVMVRQLPIGLLISIFSTWIWLAVDWFAYPMYFWKMAPFRLGVIEAGALLGLLLWWTGRSLWALRVNTWTLYLGSVGVVLSANGPVDPYVSGLVFIFVAPGLVVPVHLRVHLVGHVMAIIFFVVGSLLWFPEVPWGILFMQTNVLLWMAIITAVGLFYWRSQKRIELETQHQLQESNRALLIARDQAREGERAKAAFLANMSHELRTPLNAVIGYAEMVREDLEEFEDAAVDEHVGDLGRIEAAGHYLLRLINDILDLSKIEAGRLEVRLERVDLLAVANEVSSMADSLCKTRGHSFALEAVEGVVQADPLRLRQILLNLISNAVKFTDNGTIKLVGTPTSLGVVDTGMGMDAEQLGRLFKPFEQVHRIGREKFGGTGLGLALSRDLARAMGADLTVESEPGKGSVFTVSFAAGVAQKG